MEWLNRSYPLLGEDNIKLLQQKHVLIVGLGGVGSFAAECICRSGIGKISVIDADKIELSNLNRQTIALQSNLGCKKIMAMQNRLLDINPKLQFAGYDLFLDSSNLEQILEPKLDFIIDAIDTIEPKVRLILAATKKNINIISVMGSGGKLAPELIQIVDISDTKHCSLARTIRRRLHRHGFFGGLPVVFSPERVQKSSIIISDSRHKKSSPGTVAWMPAVFGAFAASAVIRQLIDIK